MVNVPNRVCVAVALVAAFLAAGFLSHDNASQPRVMATCNDVVDTTDSFSMNCVPTMIPDMSDQLTEAEVAQPGWNAGSGAAPGSGAHH